MYLSGPFRPRLSHTLGPGDPSFRDAGVRLPESYRGHHLISGRIVRRLFKGCAQRRRLARSVSSSQRERELAALRVALLRTSGCEVAELDCTPDWSFRRHNPNPEDIMPQYSEGHSLN